MTETETFPRMLSKDEAIAEAANGWSQPINEFIREGQLVFVHEEAGQIGSWVTDLGVKYVLSRGGSVPPEYLEDYVAPVDPA